VSESEYLKVSLKLTLRVILNLKLQLSRS